MGKRAVGKRGSCADLGERDCDSVASSSTTWTTCRPDFIEEEDANDPFADALDNLLEKRGSTREAALRTLAACYRDAWRAEEAGQNQTTVIGRCINGMRRGGAAEAALSAQLYALHIVTLPEQDENNFLEAQFELQRSAASGASPEVRVAAVEALAMGCFVSVDDDGVRGEVLERLRALWAPRGGAAAPAADAATATAALRGWGLVLTSLDGPLPAATLQAALVQLAALLHASNVEVRAAAGEALSLVYSRGGSSARGLLQSLAEGEEEEEGEEEDAAGDEEMEDGAAAAPDPALLSRMRQLAVAHPSSDALRRSKRDRAAQRSAFRGILASVERGGAVAATKVKLQHGGALVVDTVEGSARLAAFRRVLAGGFQVHLQSNPLLHAVFGFTPAAGPKPRLSALEKKATRSSNSADAKWRTADRKGSRAQKSMAMMGGGGDDY